MRRFPKQYLYFIQLKLPAGLVNLGNTCYLNSTIQCLRAVPELAVAIKKSSISIGNNQSANFAVSMKALFEELDSSGTAVQPIVFLQMLRTLFPQFSERDRNGFMQQDAEECWGQLVHGLAEQVKGLDENGESKPDTKFVDQFMTAELISETKCDEASEEAPSLSVETVNKLRVNISAGVSTYMVQEIANGLVEKIEKNSPSLNRNAVYTKTSKISRLPQYLTVNFVRFQWKPQEQIKAKIMKRVQFPFELDMYPYCASELQKKMEPARQRIKEISERKAEEKKKKIKVDEEMKEPKDQKTLLKELGVDSQFITDPGLNPSGMYDLAAVLTHVGRGANSGHYIGWAKDLESDNWWKFDDDKVSQIKPEDITKLEGGQGDAPSAYIIIVSLINLVSR
jgi:ubiquitin carboxyl-terminal hydrolase 14